MTRPARLGIAVAALVAVVVSDFVIRPGGSSRLEALRTMLYRFLTGDHRSPVDDEPTTSSPAGKPKSASRAAVNSAKRVQQAEPRAVVVSPEALPESRPAPDLITRNAGAAGAIGIAEAPAVPPSLPRRAISYLPGQHSGWTAYGPAVETPRMIRAAGQISIGDDASDPNGLRDSKYERSLRRQSEPGWNERVVPSAPYLALIGRVCSDRNCSAPFFVGANAVVCPSDSVPGPVQLQLWTNNYVRVQGRSTLGRYADVVGGFSVYAEAAPDDACGSRSGAPAVSHDATPIAAGEVLRGPDLRVSSNQTWWKPFFVPLGQPLLIRAAGEVQPRVGATATGPNGIEVPFVPRWFYPGAPTVVVDAEHKLYDRGLPYQALIGRLCGAGRCGPAFLVGRERTVCTKSPHDDHLELWINHIVGSRGRLDGAMPRLMDKVELQQERRGEYRFEVSRAPTGACGPTVSIK